MERHQPLDPARRPAAAALIRFGLLLAFAPLLAAQDADTRFRQGMDLARKQRWAEAKTELRSAAAVFPRDKRFPIELAGVAWKQDDLATARRYLHRALRIEPQDPYANDFLAALYLLEDNLEAALHYWNRTGKPRVNAVNIASPLRVRPTLLDRAFLFSPAATLRLPDLIASNARLQQLGIFPRHRFELLPAGENAYTLQFHAAERNGFGATTPDRLLNLLRGVFFQSVFPEYANWRGRAINIESMLRWDAQKQRASLSIASPLQGNPATRARVYLDAVRENWNLTQTFRPNVDALAFRRAAIGAELRTVANARLTWWTAAELSWRGLPNRDQFGLASNPLFHSGLAPTLHAGVVVTLLRIPARRFILTSESELETGKLLGHGLRPFARVQTGLTQTWLPQPKGDDYRIETRLRAGTLRGDAPFDRLFQLGVERDNLLWLRGHAGTAAGRKGSAPLGREFVLVNWEVDKSVYRHGFWSFAVGPFLDTGKIWDNRSGFGSPRWLTDTGLQCKLRVLTGATVVLSWGRDLRSGGNTFYARLGR